MPTKGPSIVVNGVTVRDSEVRVLKLLVKGKLNKQIADELGIHLNTVIDHLKNVSRKLGMHNRVQIAVWAVKNGIE